MPAPFHTTCRSTVLRRFWKAKSWSSTSPDWTSFDVVNKVRYALRGFTGAKKIKVGHAGTLDPLATGVLVVCCGRATKTIDTLQAQAKVYTATVRLGPTRRRWTRKRKWTHGPRIPPRHLTDRGSCREGRRLVDGHLGTTTSLYSAKKVDGVKAYDAARKGPTSSSERPP